MDEQKNTVLDGKQELPSAGMDTSGFADSYASFSRIVNSLKRQYIELKEEFSTQNEKLAEANRRLVELTESNLAVNQFLNGILNSIPVGVITVDKLGIVTHLNPAGSTILNKDPRKSVGRDYAETMPQSDGFAPGAITTMDSEQQVTSVEKSVEIEKNRTLRLSVSTALLRDENGQCTGAVEVFQDMTKVRRLEHENARLNTLAALGEMAATIAHEVRNPLSGIGGFAALLERDFETDDPKVALIEKIKMGVESLNGTVTKLLNYTRFNELSRTETRYIHFLRSSVEQFKHEQKAAENQFLIRFQETISTGGKDVTVYIDKILFRQCLYNILMNSVDEISGNAEIDIKINVFKNSEIPVSFTNKINLDFDESLLVTTISDNGPGIRSEHRDKIFAPFFTTKSGGSGLGLAIAWKLIKAHGGEIILDEGNTVGATFHILIPARTENSYLENE